MKSQEIRDLVTRTKMGEKSVAFWLVENAIQTAELNEKMDRLISLLSASQKKPAVRKPGASTIRTRRYYVTEYVPALPPKFDRISDTKPTNGIHHHEIIAHNLIEATKLITEKLTKEREADQERAASLPDDEVA